jgi:hypothetical protein
MTESSPTTIAPVYPSADAAMTAEKIRELNDERMRADQKHRDRLNRVDNAWSSPEATAVREFVQQDGNVDWRPFVSHCGGILEVVGLVGEDGTADADRIVPLIDAMFAKTAVTKMVGGLTMTRYPRNRPYRPQGRTVTDREPVQQDAERLLEESQQTRPRTSGLR